MTNLRQADKSSLGIAKHRKAHSPFPVGTHHGVWAVPFPTQKAGLPSRSSEALCFPRHRQEMGFKNSALCRRCCGTAFSVSVHESLSSPMKFSHFYQLLELTLPEPPALPSSNALASFETL